MIDCCIRPITVLDLVRMYNKLAQLRLWISYIKTGIHFELYWTQVWHITAIVRTDAPSGAKVVNIYPIAGTCAFFTGFLRTRRARLCDEQIPNALKVPFGLFNELQETKTYILSWLIRSLKSMVHLKLVSNNDYDVLCKYARAVLAANMPLTFTGYTMKFLE